MRKILVLFTLILALSLSASAWAADASFTIGTDFDTITEALESADESGFADVEIILSSAYPLASESLIYTSTYSNVTNITITGGNYVMTPASGTRHFVIDSSTEVTFNSVRFRGGSGGIKVDSGTLTLTGCIFMTNSAANGGALEITGGTVTATATEFNGNKASSNGGAIYVTGGTVELTNAIFTGNEATSGGGGAIYVSGGTVTLAGSNTFTNTNNAANGGAIYVDGGTVNLESSNTFNSNNATTNGGAICVNSGTVNLSGTADFTSNTAANGAAIYSASSLTIADALTFTSNTATSNGGAVYIADGTTTFSGKPVFTGNTASSNGGAVYNAGTMNFTSAPEFTSNTSTSNGGAVYNSGTMTFSGAPIFDSNSSSANGGAIYLTDGTLTFSDSANIKTNHSATDGGAIYVASGTLTGTNANLTFTGNYSSAYSSSSNSESSQTSGNGGAICIAGGTVNLGSVTITDHTAVAGGAIYISDGDLNITGTAAFTRDYAYDGGALCIEGGTTKFSGAVTFTNNRAFNDGGAIYLSSSAAATSLAFSESGTVSFTTNQANYDQGNIGNGGAIYWGLRGDYFTTAFGSASSVLFTDNYAMSSNTDSVTFEADYGNGGAIYCAGTGTLTINGSSNYTFTGNKASSNGGAIFSVNAKILIQDIDITEANTAEYGGGGFAASSSGDITVNNASISNQDADKGGALYSESMTISSSDFSSNTAGSGGAIFTFYKNSTGKVTITESIFTSNKADEAEGGAITARTANFSLTNTFFGSNNAAGNGGAVDIGGQSTSTIKQVTFSDNEGANGGALCAKGTVQIDSTGSGLCYFVNNHATDTGGAIHYDQTNGTGKFEITSSMFENNTATKGSGGAAYIASDVALIESCTFNKNVAGTESNSTGSYGGGAVFMSISGRSREGDDAGRIINSVFTRNQVLSGTNSCGGAISLMGTVKVISCTLSISNTVTNYGGGIFIGNNSTLYISGTLAVGNSAQNGGDVYKGDGASRISEGYNRIGVYGTGGNNTGWKSDNGLDSDRENTTWTKADFYGDNDLADNVKSDTVPPVIGSSVGTIGTLRLKSLMLNEAESLELADRATTVIPFILRYNFPQYDIRGVDRRELGTMLDIGAVFYDGTTRSDEDDEKSHYSIASVKMSGIPNSMKGIGQTASIIAVVRYTNGRSAFGGSGTDLESVTWESLPNGNNVIRVKDGVLTSLGEGTAYIVVTVTRAKQDGTYASDRKAVKVTYDALLNLAPEFFEDFYKFLEELYEYDMSVAMTNPDTATISSSSFKKSFKDTWNADASAVQDMSNVYPDFSLKAVSSYKANSQAYISAAKAQ